MSKLLAEITDACRQLGIAPTNFGREAVGDPRLVNDLRNGRQPTSRTIARVRAYMEGLPLAAPKLRVRGGMDDSLIDITAELLKRRRAMAQGSARLLAAIRRERGEA